MRRQSNLLFVVTGMLLLLPETAAGYVGPGAGLTAIGAALAFIGAILLGVFGFVWYPFKRLYRALTKKGDSPPNEMDS
jgi:hypothetical protein